MCVPPHRSSDDVETTHRLRRNLHNHQSALIPGRHLSRVRDVRHDCAHSTVAAWFIRSMMPAAMIDG